MLIWRQMVLHSISVGSLILYCCQYKLYSIGCEFCITAGGWCHSDVTDKLSLGVGPTAVSDCDISFLRFVTEISLRCHRVTEFNLLSLPLIAGEVTPCVPDRMLRGSRSVMSSFRSSLFTLSCYKLIPVAAHLLGLRVRISLWADCFSSSTLFFFFLYPFCPLERWGGLPRPSFRGSHYFLESLYTPARWLA
jgi:hypothetical protein